MKKISRWLLGFMAVMMLTMIPAGSAKAAIVSNKLFDMILDDGWSKVTVPVYEYKTETATAVAALKAKRVVTTYARATSMKITVTNKTSYYKNNYMSLRYPPTVALLGTKKLVMTATTRSGIKRNFPVTVIRPAMPRLSATAVSNTVMTQGRGRIKATATLASSITVRPFLQVTNASGKWVYRSALKNATRESLAYYWDGKASANNAAGITAGTVVPAGEYTMTVFIKYTCNGRYRFFGSGKKVTIKAAAATPTTVGKDWDWNMIITGDDELDYLAEMVCQSVLKPGMTEIQRAKALYTWYNGHFTYNRSGAPIHIPYETEAAKAKIAVYGKEMDARIASGRAVIDNDDAFSKVKTSHPARRISMAKLSLSRWAGDCHYISNSYEILLRHAGIQANYIENTHIIQREPFPHHYWNTVRINGKWYFADARQIVGFPLTYNYFLRGTTFMYQNPMWANVRTYQTQAYVQARSVVVASDCPGR